MLLLLFLLPWILHSNWICFSVQSHNYLCILYIIVFKYFSVDFNLPIGTTLFCKSSFVFDEQQKLWFLLTMNTEFLCIDVNDLVHNSKFLKTFFYFVCSDLESPQLCSQIHLQWIKVYPNAMPLLLFKDDIYFFST